MMIISLDRPPKLIRREPLKHDILRRDPTRRGDHDLRKPTFAELGLRLTVTIGIAVKPQLGDFIVTVSDQRQSFQDFVQPIDAGMIKVSRLTKKWAFLFAGGQVGYARTVKEKAVSILGNPDNEKSFAEVVDAVRRAYEAVSNGLIHHRYLARFGFESVNDFRENAVAQLGARTASRISSKIERFDLGMQFLLFGFEEFGFARFAEISENEIVDHSDVDDWAVGTGFYLALGSLNSRQRGEQSIAKIVKDACEAKFCAESADAVGQHTSVYVWYQNGYWWQMPTPTVNKLRDEWHRERSKSVTTETESEKIIESAFSMDQEFTRRMAQWRVMTSRILS